MKRNLLIFGLLCLPFTRGAIDLDDAFIHMSDIYLPRNLVPNFYKLKLTADPDKGEFYGVVIINVTCVEPTNEISLHVHEDLIISHRTVNVTRIPSVYFESDSDLKISYLQVPITSVKKKFLREWYTIILAQNLIEGNYEISIPFSGQFNDATQNAFFRMSYEDKSTGRTLWYAATDMKSTKARWVFPCLDEPSFKTPFEISIAAHEKYRVVSNMPEIHSEQIDERAHWLWHHFETTPPLSTFSIGFALVQFDRKQIFLNNSEAVINALAPPDIIQTIENTERIILDFIQYCEEFFNVSLPPKKLDLVFLPEYGTRSPADHWGLLLYSINTKMDTTDKWKNFENIASQWLRHLTTPYWWSNTPILAFFLRYFVITFENKETETTVWDEFSSKFYTLYGSPGNHNNDVIDLLREAWMFRVLNYTLSPEILRSGIQTLLENKQFKTYSEGELLTYWKQEALETGIIDQKFHILEFSSSWRNRNRYPVVTFVRNYQDNSASAEQNIFLQDITINDEFFADTLFYIPLTYITEDNWNVSSNYPVKWMRREKYVTINNGLPEPDKFVIVDPDDIGLYIVNYDLHNWALLSNYLLKSSEGLATLLPSQTRAKLLHNALSLAISGKLRFHVALNMTQFLQNEMEDKVWNMYYSISNIISNMVEGTNASKMFEEYNLSLYKNFLRNLEETGRGNTVPELRIKKKILGKMESEWSEELYEDKYKTIVLHWLENPVSLDNMMSIDSIVCGALKYGSRDEKEFVLKEFINGINENTKYLDDIYWTLATCVNDEDNIKRVLQVILLEDNKNAKVSVIKEALDSLSGYQKTHKVLFDYVVENWDKLKERHESNQELWSHILKSILKFKTLEGFHKAAEFYNEKRYQFGSAEITVKDSLYAIKKLVQWRKTNVPIIEEWLSSHQLSTS